MAAKRIPQLDPVSAANVDNGDSLVLFDAGADETKRVLRSNLYGAGDGSAAIGYNQGDVSAVDRNVLDKLQEFVSVKDFGAVGDGTTDDTAAIQAAINAACPSKAFINYGANEIKPLWFPNGVYKVTNLLLQHKLSTNNDGRFFRVYGEGSRIEQIGGTSGPVFEISSCKRLHISDLQIVGETYITGMWDSVLQNVHTGVIKFGTRNASGTSLFASNYWNHFERCRMGAIEFKIYDSGNQEFNANTFSSCISSGIAIVGNAGGSFQGNTWTGGELRGNPFISIDAARNSATPNSLTIISAYFDQSGVQTELYDFEVKTLGVCPAVNGYVLDGQPFENAGSTQHISLDGVRMGQRTPVSAANLIINGDHSNAAVGETTATIGAVSYNVSQEVFSTGGVGAFSKYVSYENTGTFPYVSYRTRPVPHTGAYTLTVVYRKPTSPGALQVRFAKSTNGSPTTFFSDVYNAFANAQTIRDEWLIASYTLGATAGEWLHVHFYGGDISSGAAAIDVAYVGCTAGGTGIIFGDGAPTTTNQPLVVWRTAAPSAGTWARGDIVWNLEPSAGGTPGWVCVTAGTPGTWKAMANLAA